MATPEDEIKDLREKNNELVQKVQYWKMTAAQKENEKLELMKEINELRLKLSRLRSGGAAQARKLDAALQSASEEALSHLVQASGAVARTIELAKTYMRDRQELDTASPRWSNISGTPNREKIHRVLPMNMGGQSIQPVVSLSRALLNTSNPRTVTRSPDQNRSITERAVPMHMLQDVYIPLTRIDANDFTGNTAETEPEANDIDNSTEDLGLDDSNERSLEAAQNVTEEDFEASRRLDAVTEDVEPEDEVITPPRRIDNPLEGPSWLLDRPSNKASTSESRRTLEPDSTTELEGSVAPPPPAPQPHTRSSPASNVEKEEVPLSRAEACEFSPTVRRRKRTATPPAPAPAQAQPPPPAPAPAPAHTPPHFSPRHRASTSGRVLKVVLAKMRLEEEESPAKRTRAPASPATRLMRFDAPSPNGSTDAGVIVSSEMLDESYGAGDAGGPRDPHDSDSRDSCDVPRDSRSVASRDSHDSDAEHASEGRTRRPRKAVTYKEKPLNRKMRR